MLCKALGPDLLMFRNLFAEKAVTFMTIPCEFKTFGCRVEIQYKDKEAVSFPPILPEALPLVAAREGLQVPTLHLSLHRV